MSLIFILIDRISYALSDKSFLNLSYGNGILKTLRLMLLWSTGAGFIGFLSSLMDIFEYNRNACIFIGGSWQFLIPRIVDTISHEEKQKDQTISEENGK